MSKLKILLISILIVLSLIIQKSFAQDFTPNSLLRAATETANLRPSGTIAELYDQQKKNLFYFKGKIDFIGKADFGLFIDLCDYYSYLNPNDAITGEGKAGWITVWIDLGFGISAGFPPVNIAAGVVTVPMGYNNIDPKRKWDLTALAATTPVIQLNNLHISSSGNYDLANFSFDLVLDDISVTAIHLSANLLRFEIKAEFLNLIFNTAFSRYEPGTYIESYESLYDLGSLIVQALSNKDLDSEQLVINDVNITEKFYRPFTTLENNIENQDYYDGAFTFILGGNDVDGDGYRDNYFPVIPTFLGIPIGAWGLDFVVENIGFQQINYKIKGELVEGNDWWITYNDGGSEPWVDWEYNLNEIPPSLISESGIAKAEIGIVPTAEASQKAKIRLVLYKNNLFIDEPLDSLDLEVIKYSENENNIPTLEIKYPLNSFTFTQDEDLEVIWSDLDIEDNAYVSFALDPDFSQTKPWEGENNHRWLEVLTREDPDGTEYDRLNYNLSDVGPGGYCVWGVIFDGYNEPVYTKSPSVITIIKETKFVNGSVSPANAQPGEAFSFSVTYLPSNGLAPQNPIKLMIDNTSYDMFPNGDNWSEGVQYTYSALGSSLGEGEHKFYFTTEVDNQILRYPESGYLYFSVSSSLSGHDLGILNLKLDNSWIKPGSNLYFNFTVRNYSSTYSEDNYTLNYKLINSETDELIKDVTENGGVNISPNTSSPTFSKLLDLDKLEEGFYRLEVTANLPTDNALGNNKAVSSVYIGATNPYTTYSYIDPGLTIHKTGQTINYGGYDVELLNHDDKTAKVNVSNTTTGFSETRYISKNILEFFDASRFALNYLAYYSSSELSFKYCVPSDEISFDEVNFDLEAGINKTIHFNSNDDDVKISVEPLISGTLDEELISDWSINAYSILPPFKDAYLEIKSPTNQERKGYEFWLEFTLDGDFIQKFKINVIDPVPDFSILADQSSLNIAPQIKGLLNLEFNPLYNFNEAIVLSAEGLPNGVTVTFSENDFEIPADISLEFEVESDFKDFGYYKVDIQMTSYSKTKKYTIGLNIIDVSSKYIKILDVGYIDKDNKNDSLQIEYDVQFTANTGSTVDWKYSLDGQSFVDIPSSQILNNNFKPPGEESIIWDIPDSPILYSNTASFKMRHYSGASLLKQIYTKDFSERGVFDPEFTAVIFKDNIVYAYIEEDSDGNEDAKIYKYQFTGSDFNYVGKISLPSDLKGDGDEIVYCYNKYYLRTSSDDNIHIFNSSWNRIRSVQVGEDFETFFEMNDSLYFYEFETKSFLQLDENIQLTGQGFSSPYIGNPDYSFFDGRNIWIGDGTTIQKISQNFDSFETYTFTSGRINDIAYGGDKLYSVNADDIYVFNFEDPNTLFSQSSPFVLNNTYPPVIGELPFQFLEQDSAYYQLLNLSNLISDKDTDYDLLEITIENPNSNNIAVTFNANNPNYLDLIPISSWKGLFRFKVIVKDDYNTVEKECTVIINSIEKEITQGIHLLNGWNMVSVPVLAEDMSGNSLFPNKEGSIYKYENGYQVVDTLKTGVGYWEKNSKAESVNVCGVPVSGDITVKAGWNMIGIYDISVPVGNVTSSPANITTTPYYGYNTSGYYVDDTLKVGEGYWIKCSQDGVLQLNSTTVLAKTGSSKQVLAKVSEDWGKVTITDARERSKVMYLAPSGTDGELYSVPPAPPEGIFDVRFSCDSYVKEEDNIEEDLLFSSVVYPVRITVEGIDVRIADKLDGSLVNKVLVDGSSYVISNESVERLLIEMTEIPISYELKQNYPNPFNPSTTIQFGLPEVSKVKLHIYNVLGQRVATLIDKQMDIGYHKISFDASQLASGVYIYRIETPNFVNSKKMLLMK